MTPHPQPVTSSTSHKRLLLSRDSGVTAFAATPKIILTHCPRWPYAHSPLRAGKNELICLASDPAKTAFNVACYHRDLAAYMERGRALLADKVTGPKRNDLRWKEIEEGKLAMPRAPRTLYVLTGSSYDAASGKVADAYLRWVIYLPYATPETTGLSTKGSDNAPWLMYPGTAGAHIIFG